MHNLSVLELICLLDEYHVGKAFKWSLVAECKNVINLLKMKKVENLENKKKKAFMVL